MEMDVTAFDRIAANIRDRRLYKDPVNGMILGVCAGIAGWLGIRPWFIRLLAALSFVFIGSPVPLAYLAAALVLDKRPAVGRYDRFRHHRYG